LPQATRHYSLKQGDAVKVFLVGKGVELDQIEDARFRPGLCGDRVAWNSVRSLPYGNSPLYYKGRLFTVKSGGFVTAYDAKTGQPIYQEERINAPDDYWSSPVAAAGRVYFASEKGVVTVMDATADPPPILAQNKLNEQILATPALIDQTILIRTANNLYSFGASK
jgi:outer membrane protein assembly factor BamB